MRRRLLVLAGLLGVPAALAPKPVSRRVDLGCVDDVVALSQAQGLAGWDLVDFACAQVCDKFSKYSAWHLWESPTRAFANSRGMSVHYNQVLAEVLTRLGFRVSVVQAARVRRETIRPWWLASHVWLRVSYGRHERDVCAGDIRNRAGNVHFIAISEVRPFRKISHVALCALGALPVAVGVWSAWVRGREVPGWLYRDFHEPRPPEGAAS